MLAFHVGSINEKNINIMFDFLISLNRNSFFLKNSRNKNSDLVYYSQGQGDGDMADNNGNDGNTGNDNTDNNGNTGDNNNDNGNNGQTDNQNGGNGNMNEDYGGNNDNGNDNEGWVDDQERNMEDSMMAMCGELEMAWKCVEASLDAMEHTKKQKLYRFLIHGIKRVVEDKCRRKL